MIALPRLFFAALILVFGLAGFSRAQSELRHPSGQDYLDPEETVRRFEVPDGFEVNLFAAEPDLINPIAMAFDERGRLFVVESFEYPKGTPPGETPKDRIKIFEDTNGDGRADKITVYAEGFNLATGIAVGHGGVFVGAAPDLWFLRDTDGDDRADTREVLLTGFGRHDTHELLNTFTWGPDGWLYGLHGVFTQSEVNGIKMDAAVWRYHPRSRRFERFAEGTSNPWGIDFDDGGRAFLTACVIPHLFYMVPGGRYIRQGGQNQNPYDFGQLPEISDHQHHEESGWAHSGCVVIEGPTWPEELRGSVIFGSIHGCSIKRDVLSRRGSSFIASHAPDFLKSGDRNFRPVHQEVGPDGAIYVTDWHDQWPCHQTPPDLWDKERGRIYRIVYRGTKNDAVADLGQRSNRELVGLLRSPNPYLHRTARRLLDERQARDAAPELVAMLFAREPRGPDAVALRALWTLDALGEFDESLAVRCLEHPSADVRAWAVRCLGEAGAISSDLAHRLAEVAETDGSADVRLQLAASCQRLDAAAARPILEALARHDEDADDPMLPLMIWFAYEGHLPERAEEALDWLRRDVADHAIVREAMLPRVLRRLASTGKSPDLAATLQFSADLGEAPLKRAALEGVIEALEEGRTGPPENWTEVRRALLAVEDRGVQSAALRVGAHLRDPVSVARLSEVARDRRVAREERTVAVQSLAAARLPETAETLQALLVEEEPLDVRRAALVGLGQFPDRDVAEDLLARWAELSDVLRAESLRLFATRATWADVLLDALADGRLQATELSTRSAQQIAALERGRLRDKLARVWGTVTVRRQTPEEMEQLLKRMARVVREQEADSDAGRLVFEKTCAVCHRFQGRGATVGPDLTGADRSVDYLLLNILDPNRVVGQPYFTHVVATTDGRVITGRLLRETPQAITLVGENDKVDTVPRADVEEHVVKTVSVMPEGLPKDMSDEQFRNLVGYLRRR